MFHNPRKTEELLTFIPQDNPEPPKKELVAEGLWKSLDSAWSYKQSYNISNFSLEDLTSAIKTIFSDKPTDK